MYINELKEKLENREKIYSTMLTHIGFTTLPKIYKAGGLDMLVMDLEHGSFYPENIGDFLQVCHYEKLPVIVSSPELVFAVIPIALTKLDAGTYNLPSLIMTLGVILNKTRPLA